MTTSYCSGCGRFREDCRARREHAERWLCDECAAKPPIVDYMNPPDAPPRDAAHNLREFFRAQRAAGQDTRQIEAPALSSIEMRSVDWAWQGWVPLRSLTLLSGESGLGKSTLLAHIAAHTTRGTLPGHHYGEPGSVVWVSYEDTAAEVLKPRLVAAGADPERVHVVRAREAGVEDVVTLPGDAAALGEIAERTGAKLVVVDPVLSAMANGVDTHRTQDVRRALAVLQALAESKGFAVVAVLHFKKGEESNPLARVEASGAFTQLARSVIVFGVNPESEGGRDGPERVLVHAKSNLSRLHAAESFTIETVKVGPLEIETTRLVANGACAATAEDLSRPASREDRSELQDAKDAILEFLQDGPLAAAELKRMAVDDGIAEKTFSRARTALYKEGKTTKSKPEGGSWQWRLSDDAGKKASKKPNGKAGLLGPLGLLDPDVERAERLLNDHADVAGGRS